LSDIFISYARSTEEAATRIADTLGALSYSVWRDDQLPAHRAYGEVIEERLRAAKAVIVLWSAEAVKSQWVRAEADVARQTGRLVQLSLDGTTPPLPFNQIQCADMIGWTGDHQAPGWRKLLQSLAELLGEEAAAPAPAVQVGPLRLGPSLAVLAFDNLSADPEMVYFSDGVSEEILQTVSRACEVTVIARASSFQFRGAAKNPRRIAAELNVSHLLDGSVRRSGARVRVSAQLVDCASQTTVWSDNFDRELSDVFALQDEIAGEVAGALKVAFAPSASIAKIDPTAYDLYLRARNLIVERDPAPSIELLQQVVALAPDFAAAWAALCWALAAQARRGPRPAPFPALKAAAVAAAETALRLDPNAGLAYAALSNLEPIARYGEREQLLRRALEVAPNATETLTVFGAFCNHVGFIEEALTYLRRAYELDPLYARAADVYSTVLHAAGRISEAEDLVELCRRRWPERSDFTVGEINSTAFSRNWPKFDRLVAAARAAGEIAPNLNASIRLGEALRDGPEALAPRALERLHHQLAETGSLPLPLLITSAALGLKEEVFVALEAASYDVVFDEAGSDPSGAYNPGIIFDPGYNGELMNDIRFVGLCAKLGLCDYWVDADRWPDCAARLRGLYDFKAEARRLAGQTRFRQDVPPGD